MLLKMDSSKIIFQEDIPCIESTLYGLYNCNSNLGPEINRVIVKAKEIRKLFEEDNNKFQALLSDSYMQIKSLRLSLLHENQEKEVSDNCFTDGIGTVVSMDDSKSMIEELEQLDCKDNEKIDLLINDSVSIFMKSVFSKLNSIKNLQFENQLKQIFIDYGDALTKKLREIPALSSDPNDTRNFEDIEREIRLQTEIDDIKKQMVEVTHENKSLKLEREEIVQLRQSIGSVSLRGSLTRMKELDVIGNINMSGTSLVDSKDFECTGEPMEITKNLFHDESDSLVEYIRSDIMELKEESERMSEGLKQSQIYCKELKIVNESLTNEINTLKATLHERILELVATKEDCIKVNEKLDSANLRLKETDDQYRQVLSDLASSQEHLEIIREEKEVIQNELFKITQELVEKDDGHRKLIEDTTKNELEMNLELDTISEKLNLLQSRYEKLEIINASLNDQLSIENDKLQSLSDDNKNMVKNLESKDLLISDMESEVSRLISLSKMVSENLESNPETLEGSSLILDGKTEKCLQTDDTEESLQIEINNARFELQYALDNLTKSQARSDELELQSTLYQSQIKALSSDLEEIQIDYETCQINLELSDGTSQKLKEELACANEIVESMKIKYILLEEEKNNVCVRLDEMNEKMKELILENEQLSDRSAFNEMENELVLKNAKLDGLVEEMKYLETKFCSVKGELEILNQRLFENDEQLFEKDSEIGMLKEQITVLQTNLDERNAELVVALDDCIKVNEELDNFHLELREKDEQYRNVCILLDSTNLQLGSLSAEKKTLENDFTHFRLSSEKNAQEFATKIKEHQEIIVVLEEENQRFTSVNLAKNELEVNLKEIELKYIEIMNEQMLTQEEKNKLQDQVDNLERIRSDMLETINILNEKIDREGKEHQSNMEKMSILELNIESQRLGFQKDLENTSSKLQEVTYQLNNRELEIRELTIQNEAYKEKFSDLVAEVLIKTEKIEQLILDNSDSMNKMKEMKSELDNYQKKTTKINELEESLKEAKEQNNILTNELSLAKIELLNCKTEIETLNTAKLLLHDYEKKLSASGMQIEDQKFELKSLMIKFKDTERDNKELRQKVQNNFTDSKIIQKLKNDVKNYKTKLDKFENNNLENDDQIKEQNNRMESEINKLRADLAVANSEIELLNKENNVELIEQIKKANSNLENELKIVQQKLEDQNKFVEAYTVLKEKYVDKRKRTEVLTEKYGKLVEFCKANNYVYPK